MALPAYDQCIKASHVFNLLDARGVISVTERQSYIMRVRELAKACGEAWVNTEAGGASGRSVVNMMLSWNLASTNLLPSPAREARGGEGSRGGGVDDTDHRSVRLTSACRERRSLRRDATEAEKKLWQHLRQPPFKQRHFRRQATIGPYFADFATYQANAHHRGRWRAARGQRVATKCARDI